MEIVIGDVKVELPVKTYSTGSTGFEATGKFTIDGVKYWGKFTLVKSGSKPK